MSWLFSQALAAEYSVDNCSDGTPFAPSSVTTMPAAYLSHDKTTVTSRRSRSGMTFALLMDARGEELLTSFLAAFRAKTYLLPVKEQESLENEADSGEKWQGLLARFDQDTLSWKTAQPLSQKDSGRFSEIWPRWGMMRDGDASALNIPAHLMGATEFGLLRRRNRDNQYAKQTTDGSAIGAPHQSLAADATTENGSASTAENGPTRFIMKNGTAARSAAPPMWPTPQANEDAAGTPAGKMQRMLGNHPAVRGNSPEEWKTGTLNPTWVEWLMGWPLGWTALEPLGTDKYQQWRRLHGERCELD